MTTLRHPPSARHSRGFSIIEILVGVAIGMVGLLAMFQMLTLWEARTKTSSSGGDAQVTGNLAMFNLERDLKLAGVGFNVATSPIMGCMVTARDEVNSRDFTFRLAPVEITQGASNAPDRITVLYGNSSFVVDKKNFTISTASTKRTQSRNGMQAGDLVVVTGNDTGAVASANCHLIEINKNNAADNLTIGHDTTNYTSFYAPGTVTTPRFNPAAGTGVTYSSGILYNLGPTPQRNVWSIANGRVLGWFEDIRSSAVTEVTDGVVNLQAEYGVDSNNDNEITDGSGGTPDEWVTAAPNDWTKVRAVRLALLVRSNQYERTMVTTAAPTWTASVPGAHATAHPESAFVMTDLNGTARQAASPDSTDPNDWRHYRYRVFEKVIPLRNMIWASQ